MILIVPILKGLTFVCRLRVGYVSIACRLRLHILPSDPPLKSCTVSKSGLLDAFLSPFVRVEIY